MPFAVFRQHQRKLLAAFALMAMLAFVLSDTLSRSANKAPEGQDREVAELYGKKVRLSDLNAVRRKRQYANQFMALADPYAGITYFGGMSQPEIIDALILEHEANRLGIPSDSSFARSWIDRQTNGAMNASLFEVIRSRFEGKVGGEELLNDIASQARLLLARQEIAMPVITPLDVYRNYRDQTERTSFKAVPYMVESFLNQVGEPTESEIADLYEKYKEELPDIARPTPGFKIPRKVNAEFLRIDINQIAKRIKASLPETEIKAYYDAHKTSYPMDVELPANLFAGAPELTPPRYTPLEFVRESIAEIIAREKANDELQETFTKIRDEEIDKFADAYHATEEEITDAKREGMSTDNLKLPERTSLASVAARYGMRHEETGLIDRREAETYPVISLARAGFNPSSSTDSKSFADIVFGPKNLLFESFEMSDILGDRYLGRKIADEPAHVAPLSEVRDQVVRAWKLDKARPLAEKAATEYAAKLRTQGGQIKEMSVDTRPVLDIDSITKLQPGMEIPSQFPGLMPPQRGPSKATEIRQIPQPSPALLDAMFGLKPGEVAVETDAPRTTFYVVALEKRQPSTYVSLMGPTGTLSSYWRETQMNVMRKSFSEGMDRLREQAGYKPEKDDALDKTKDEDQG